MLTKDAGLMDLDDEVLSEDWVVVRHKDTGKFWGVLYDEGYGKAYGWCEKLDPYLITEYRHVKQPQDAPHRNEEERSELIRYGVVVHVELTVA